MKPKRLSRIHPCLLPTALLLSLSLARCGGEPAVEEELAHGPGGKADSAQLTVPTLVFDKDWNERATSPVVAGGKLAIDYDEGRLPNCRASHNGNPGWQITAHLLFLPGGATAEAPLFDYRRTESGAPDYYSWVKQTPTVLVPAGSTEVRVWFHNTSAFDHPCSDWDSDYGDNYRFPVQKPAPSASLSFKADWTIDQQGSPKRGALVEIGYDTARLVAIARGPNPSYSTFASKYHCYGYGCCDHSYQNTLRVRFSGGGSFESFPLDGTPMQVAIPTDAAQLEFYFDTEVSTQVWYCGSSPPGPRTTVGPDWFYDSNYGQNYVFPI
jgi:hypothetical protein